MCVGGGHALLIRMRVKERVGEHVEVREGWGERDWVGVQRGGGQGDGKDIKGR